MKFYLSSLKDAFLLKSLVRTSKLAILFFIMCGSGLQIAQAQTVLFEDHFGTPAEATTRKKWPYMGTGANSFIFAHPDAPDLPGTNDVEQAKKIENNFYAVVGPKYIYTSVNHDPGYKLWGTLPNKGDATLGHNGNGGALIVNSGLTLSGLYVRFTDLEAGKYYKLSYMLYVENPEVQVNHKIISASGNTTVAEQIGELNGQNNQPRDWNQQEYWFFLPEDCTTTGFNVALLNAVAANFGYDFAVDDLMFQEYNALPADVNLPAGAIIQCNNIVEPLVNDDEKLNQSINNSVAFNIDSDILINDTTANGAPATTTNVSIQFLTPFGAVNEQTWGGETKINVPGEGLWTYTPSLGTLVFTPATGFVGNPTPITYTITDLDTNSTSGPASVVITYAGNPVANNDNGNVGTPLDILRNDALTSQSPPEPENVTVTLINPYTNNDVIGNTLTVDDEGTWTYTPTTGFISFIPLPGFTTNPTNIGYKITEISSGVSSGKATITLINDEPVIVPEPTLLCTESVDGENFSWDIQNSTDSQITQTLTQPGTNGGFIFDIYRLDNSFNMEINGVKLAEYEIEFQSDATPAPGINIEFEDGDQYETDTYAKIWQMTGTAERPLIRVQISPTGEITMYGSKTLEGGLFPLKFKQNITPVNSFNTINWNTTTDNTVIVTQNVVYATLMDGYGSGQNIVPCETYTLEKEGTFNDENNDGFAQLGETITYTLTVSNKEDIDIYDLVLEDPILGGVLTGPQTGDTNNDGILNVYETWVYTASYTITAADIANKGVYNLATVTGKNELDEDLDPVTSLDPTPLDPTDPGYDPNRPNHTFVPLLIKERSLLITNPNIYQKVKRN